MGAGGFGGGAGGTGVGAGRGGVGFGGAAGTTVPMSMKTASIGSPAARTVWLDCIQNMPLNAIARHSTCTPMA